jgi:hypothetical protein
MEGIMNSSQQHKERVIKSTFHAIVLVAILDLSALMVWPHLIGLSGAPTVDTHLNTKPVFCPDQVDCIPVSDIQWSAALVDR